MTHDLVLRFRAPDRPGILAAIAPLLADQGCDIRPAAVDSVSQIQSYFGRFEIVNPVDIATLDQALIPAVSVKSGRNGLERGHGS